jgi:hypothetical protein
MMIDEIVELDFGITPEAAVSGAVVVQTERMTILTFNGMRSTGKLSPYGGPYRESAGTAVVEFQRCVLTRFGHPNDEARWKIPKYADCSYGIYEVKNSSWIKEVVAANRHSFPATTDDYVRRHFLFAFHDSTFECLADDLSIRVVEQPYHEVFAGITSRALDERE